jgi:hypothetical protein
MKHSFLVVERNTHKMTDTNIPSTSRCAGISLYDETWDEDEDGEKEDAG